MAGKECADIVFCIDASDSMGPCIEAVKKNINCLIESLKSDHQRNWDIRIDFLAHCAGNNLHQLSSLRLTCVPMIESIYNSTNLNQNFFTSDIKEFQESLNKISVTGDECTLVALDIALDFPWRKSADCHRAVVLLTDEPIETGLNVEHQVSKITALVEKVHNKRIKLFIVAPDSEAFHKVSMADRCEYEVLDNTNDGMQSIDFKKLMDAIGKSVSKSSSQTGGDTAPNPLFNQDKWTAGSGSLGTEKGR